MSEVPPVLTSSDGGVHRTTIPVPVARFDDPHLQEMAAHPQRTERVIAVLFVLGILAIGGFGAAYWVNAQPWAQ